MRDSDLINDRPTLRRNPMAGVALGTAIVAALMVLLAGPGTRMGLWHFRTGFSLMRYGAYLAVLAALFAVVAMVLVRGRRRGVLPSVLALGIAAGTFFVPWSFLQKAKTVPPIHDISTDTRNPPPLIATLPLREETGATNPPAYEGDSIARQQEAAYPDVKPVMLAMTPDSAYGHALRAARGMGWEIVAAERDEGRIEATATTGWWGFKDDVVIRVAPASGIARVDVRSISRVGKSDVGANAERIRAYVRRLNGGR
jgi:uncharacterized protein (DUF1499 family)